MFWAGVVALALGGAGGDCNLRISNVSSTALGPSTIDLRFETSAASEASVGVWVNDSGLRRHPPPHPELRVASKTGARATQHHFSLDGLGSATPYIVRVSAGCARRYVRQSTPAPDWPSGVQCRGTALLPVEPFKRGGQDPPSEPAWLPEAPGVAVRRRAGSSETNALLPVGPQPQAGVRLTFPRALDLSGVTHLCLPLEGSRDNPDVAIELALISPAATASKPATASVRVEGLADLRAPRPWYIDIRTLRSRTGTVDLTQIGGVRVWAACGADARWSPCPNSGTSTVDLKFGELSAVQRDEVTSRPKPPQSVVYRPARLARLERGLANLGQCGPWVSNSGGPQDPVRFTYTTAMRLSVLARGWARTGSRGLLDEARAIAEAAIQLQLADGGFCDAYIQNQCRGPMVEPPKCERGPGPAAWLGLALLELRRVAPTDQIGNYDPAVRALAEHLVAQVEHSSTGRPSVSTEASISTWLFLDRATADGVYHDSGHVRERLQGAIDALWDARDGRLLIGPDDYRAAMDVSGGVGALYLRASGQAHRATQSLQFSRDMFATRSFDGRVEGLGDVLGPWTINAEWGVGQYAVAGGPDSEFVVGRYLAELGGGFVLPGSSDTFTAGFFSLNSVSPSVVATAWLYHAIEGRHFPIGRARAQMTTRTSRR